MKFTRDCPGLDLACTKKFVNHCLISLFPLINVGGTVQSFFLGTSHKHVGKRDVDVHHLLLTTVRHRIQPPSWLDFFFL
jgi:hypothetical protein